MSAFADWTNEDIARLVADYPFAWIVPHVDPSIASPVPLLLESDEMGKPAVLLGHLPRSAPLTRALEVAPTATFLFTWPHGYIAPAWLPRRDWAPTWNFATARLTGVVRFDPARTGEMIERLVRHMEGDAGWSVDALGERYERLLERVIGFAVPIEQIAVRFKLRQDESDEEFDAILAGLRNCDLAVLDEARSGDQSTVTYRYFCRSRHDPR